MATALTGERIVLADDIATLRKERIIDRLFQAYSARRVSTELNAVLDRLSRAGIAAPGEPRWLRQTDLRRVTSATGAATDQTAAAGVAPSSGVRTDASVDGGDRASRASSSWWKRPSIQAASATLLTLPQPGAMPGESPQLVPSGNKLMQELAHSDTSGAPFLATQLLKRGRSDPRSGDRPFSAPRARGGRRRSTAVDDIYNGRGDVPIERPATRQRPRSAGATRRGPRME